MGRIEKKFQKKKERERAVRKKILKKREAAHELEKKIEAQDKLERAVNKAERRKVPFRKMSPELEKTLELVESMKFEKEPDVDSTEDKFPAETTTIKWHSDDTNTSEVFVTNQVK